MKKKWITAAVILPGMLSAQGALGIAQNAFAEFGGLTAYGCDPHMRSICSSSIGNTGGNGIAMAISEHTFKLEIYRNKLSEQDEIILAGKAFSQIAPGEVLDFVMSTDLVMQDADVSSLGINPQIYNTIKAGSYPLTIESDKVIIKLKLSVRK